VTTVALPPMITVACVFVRGHVPYTPEYVVRLRAMVTKHLSLDHRFVCLTDRPSRLPADLTTLPIPGPGALAGWWSKLHLFDREQPLGDRVLYLDLDSLVVASLDPIATYPAPLALVPHTGATSVGSRFGKRVIKKFNSSVVVYDRPATYALWDAWRPEIADALHGDQDFIGEQRPDAAVMPTEWFPRVSSIGAAGQIPAEARVILSKKPKNLECAALWPWFDAIWRAA